MIKIVQLQYSTESGAFSALRFQKAFLKAGIDSCIVSLKQDRIPYERIKYLGILPKLIARADDKLQAYLLHDKLKDFGHFAYPILGSDISQIEEIKNADYIYVHWTLSGFLNLKSLKQLAKLNKPVIFIMHDMWPITGGCHYSFDCEKYIQGCYECPMFINPRQDKYSKKAFQKKIKFYSKYDNLFFVSPSKWLYNCAKQALLTKNKPVFYIPNILDNTVFKAIDKRTARQVLNIDPEEKVISFGAVSIDSPRKGWLYLQKALEVFQQNTDIKKISVLIFGSGNNKKMAEAIPFKTRFMGYLKDEYSKALVYNATDVFIVPSLADNQPTTVQESLSCGTPVVGFDIGGIPDMINHKQNGYLAKYKDPEDIAKGIQFCLQDNFKGYMLPVFEPAVTIKKHLDLFDQIQFITNNHKKG